MQKYIIRRLLYAIPTLIGVSIVIFLALQVVPGDPVAVMLGDNPGVPIRPEDRAKIEAEPGLSDNLASQYVKWMKDVVTGNLGNSYWRADTVAALIKRRGPLTLEITIIAIIISWVVGLPVGVISALRRNTLPDYIARFFSIFFLAIPQFWLAAMIVLLFLLKWSYASPLGIINIWDDFGKNMQIVLGPAIVIGLSVSAYIARMTRSTLLEVIHEDYVRTARAKGVNGGVKVGRVGGRLLSIGD